MAFIVLLVLFILSRACTLAWAGSLWFDEAFSVHVAMQSWSNMMHLLAFEHNPWGHFFILRVTAELFGSADWVMRAPSLVAGVGTLLALYLLGKRLFNSAAVGLGASFFLSISTLHLYHQTEARMYAFVSLFSVIAIYCAWQWLNAESAHKARWLLAFALVELSLLYLHLTAWIYIVALGVIVMLEALHRKASVRAWVIVNVCVGALGFVWLVPIALFRLSQSSTASGWFFAQHEQGYGLTHLVNFLLNGESNLLARSICALMIIVLVVAAFIRIEKPTWWQQIAHPFDHDAWPFSAAFHWSSASRLLLAVVVLTMGFGFALQITVTKYLIAASLPLFLLMGYGLSQLPRRAQYFIIVVTVLIALPMHLRLLSSRHHWHVVAADVERLKSEHTDAVILVHSFAHTLPLQRYLSDDVHVIPVYPAIENESLDEAIAKHNWQGIISSEHVQFIEPAIADTSTIILVSSTNGTDIADPVKAYLWQNGWKLLERLNYTGYGDPELLLLSR